MNPAQSEKFQLAFSRCFFIFFGAILKIGDFFKIWVNQKKMLKKLSYTVFYDVLCLAFRYAQGLRLRPAIAFWANGSDFGRSSLHFEHRVRDFGLSSLHFEQRVQTLDAPDCILSKGFVLWTSLHYPGGHLHVKTRADDGTGTAG